MHSSRMRTTRSLTEIPPGQRHPPPGQSDRRMKNITSPQTSFADGIGLSSDSIVFNKNNITNVTRVVAGLMLMLGVNFP